MKIGECIIVFWMDASSRNCERAVFSASIERSEKIPQRRVRVISCCRATDTIQYLTCGDIWRIESKNATVTGQLYSRDSSE